jgi:hypothetical protein
VAVEIDISSVPAEKRNNPQFTGLLARMQAAVDHPLWQAAFAIHETGHKFYLERMGITKFKFSPPRITYDPVKDNFDGYPASVQALDQPTPLTNPNFDRARFIVDLAKTKAAGSVFARELTGVPDQGVEEDRSSFAQGYSMLQSRFKQHNLPDLPISEQEAWNQADEEIRKDLRSPAFRRQRWAEAHEIKTKLFGEK